MSPLSVFFYDDNLVGRLLIKEDARKGTAHRLAQRKVESMTMTHPVRDFSLRRSKANELQLYHLIQTY